MAYSFNKLWTALAVTLVAATNFVGASTVNYDNGCAPCCQTNACCGDFYFTAEALIFKACEDGLQYGTEVVTDGPTGVDFPTTEYHIRNVHPKWETGYRLGLGWNRPCDCLDAVVYWTSYRSHAASNFEEFQTAFTTETFIPAYGSEEFTTTDFAEAHWHLNVNLVDGELGRTFCVNPCISLRPFIGVRGAWIRQSYSIDYADFVTGVATTATFIDLKTKFEGAGLRGGLNTNWDIGCGFSLYGQFAASILWGHFDVKSNEFTPTGTGTTGFIDEQRDSFCACRAATDLAAGLEWKQCWCSDAVTLTINLGWEQHMFFNQNRFEDFSQNDNVGATRYVQYQKGDLCLSGVVVGAKLDF